MKKWIIINMIVFILFGAVALYLAPDAFSLIIVGVMVLIIAFAFGKGIWMVLSVADGFRAGSNYINVVKDVATTNRWNTFEQTDTVFHNKLLDSLWKEYKALVEAEDEKRLIFSDIDTIINEDVISLHCWKQVILQIPGSLTALGLIGTFLGLIIGISGIAFSSVDAAISSITTLLNGIETAFYTSIIGVILSMVFNISYKFAWNALLREMGLFMNEFHKGIFPDEESRKKMSEADSINKILECLERIPKGGDYFYGSYLSGNSIDAENNEKTFMTEIWEGMKNNDFIFHIQPRYNLSTKKVVSGEALMRWNHKKLGLVSPMVFLPVLEKNGYIIKLDCKMWEDVCAKIKEWLDKNIIPLPVSVNISKIDILGMDVAEFFAEMVEKYQVPPKYIHIEIAENAYTQCIEVTHETEEKLRKNGFQVIINGAKGEYDTMTALSDSHADELKMEYSVLEKLQKDNPYAIEEIIEQGRKARVKLIVSGIENIKQLNTLKKAGFDEGQGFYLSKPIDVEKFEEILFTL